MNISRQSGSKREAAQARVVAVAQAILDGRLGVFQGSRQLLGLHLDADPEMRDADLLGMIGIESQTDHLPLGDCRKEWSPEALREKDAELAEREAYFRDSAHKMCRALVERFSKMLNRPGGPSAGECDCPCHTGQAVHPIPCSCHG